MDLATLGGAGVGLVWGSLLSTVRRGLCRRALDAACAVVASAVLVSGIVLVTSRGWIGAAFAGASLLTWLVSASVHGLSRPSSGVRQDQRRTG